MQTRLLYLYENEMPTISIFRDNLAKRDQQYGTESRIESVKNVQRSSLEKADVLFLIRPNNSLALWLARLAKKTGRFLIVYADDDLYNATIEKYLDKTRRDFFRKILSYADLFCSSSPRIAEKYNALTDGKRSVVQDTTVYKNEIQPYLEKVNGMVKVVYAAGPSHSPLFMKFIFPILEELSEELKDRFSLTFVGVQPTIPQELINKAHITFAPLMPLKEYREYMYRERFDVGLAPLNHDEFSRCKYFNKYIEYSLCGIMGIFSNTEPYTYVVKDRTNGLLVEDNPQAWKAAIKESILNSQLRIQCIQNAQDHIQTDFSPEANNAKRLRLMPETERFHCIGNMKVNGVALFIRKAEYKVRHMLGMTITTLDYLRKNGISIVSKKVASHLHYSQKYR